MSRSKQPKKSPYAKALAKLSTEMVATKLSIDIETLEKSVAQTMGVPKHLVHDEVTHWPIPKISKPKHLGLAFAYDMSWDKIAEHWAEQSSEPVIPNEQATAFQNAIYGVWANQNLGIPWNVGTATGRSSLKNLPYPGLTDNRRVVLDLAFGGYRMSSEVVAKDGELLAIADPAAKFDPVPGAVVVTMPLGVAVEKLVAAGAKFDLIVCELPTEATTPMVGAWAPPAPPQAKTGRRLLIPGAPPAPKAVVGELDLAVAVWRATQALLSPKGEALLGMHVASFNRIAKEDESGRAQIWWTHLRHLSHVDVYLRKDYTNGSLQIQNHAPGRADRAGRLPHATFPIWTKGQREIFERTLRLK